MESNKKLFAHVIKTNKKFDLFIKFIKFINNHNFNKESIYFYEEYENFNKTNKCNLFNLDKDIEFKKYVPIVINYRLLINNNIFTIRYSVSHYCIGQCKFKNKINENKTSPPFIDIPVTAFTDQTIKNADDLFNHHIYFNLNTLCKEEECIDNVNFYVKTIKIIELPIILSININVSNFVELSSTKIFINKIFTHNIKIYNTNYRLIGLVSQPNEDHYVCYFENKNIYYYDSLNLWYKYDDFNGVIIKLNNIIYALDNIRSTEAAALLVYIKV